MIAKILAHRQRTAPQLHQAELPLEALCARIRPIGKEGRIWGRGQDSRSSVGDLTGWPDQRIHRARAVGGSLGPNTRPVTRIG